MLHIASDRQALRFKAWAMPRCPGLLRSIAATRHVGLWSQPVLRYVALQLSISCSKDPGKMGGEN
jgi:hypothetical protein